MSEHVCTFVEEAEPTGRLILGPCLECRTTAFDALKQTRELQETVEWFGTLVTRKDIGTAQTPSLKDYVEQLEARLARCDESLASEKAVHRNTIQNYNTVRAERDAALERVRELEARHHFGACAKCLTCSWRICSQDTPESVEMKCSNGSTFWRCDYCYSRERLATLEAGVKRYVDAKVKFMAQRDDVQVIREWAKRDAEWKAILIPLLESEQALLALRAGMR